MVAPEQKQNDYDQELHSIEPENPISCQIWITFATQYKLLPQPTRTAAPSESVAILKRPRAKLPERRRGGAGRGGSEDEGKNLYNWSTLSA